MHKSDASGKVKLVIQYSDDTAPGKLSLDLTQTSGYELLDDTYTLLSADVSKIKLQIKHSSLAGKVYLDDVSLMHNSDTSTRLVPLP